MEKKNNERERDTTFKAMKSCLARIQSILELLFPPADAPVEVITAAQERRESRMREVIALRTEELLTLTEIGRHRHRLSGQSTAIFARAETPDVYIPETLRKHKRLKGGLGERKRHL